jgi:nucleotide-binding universal stress UspA family protein
MKILLAVDGSRNSHVVQTALARPWPEGSTFCVVSVVDLRHWGGLPAMIDDARKQAAITVKQATDELVKAGYRTRSETLEGSPKDVITSQAKHWGADLILVGSHGLSLATRFLLGSAAQSVLRNAPCSVEIVRQKTAPEGMKILLATDGSAASTKAVSEVSARSWPKNSEIRIVSAVRLLPGDVPSFTSSLECSNVFDEVMKSAKKRAEGAVVEAQLLLTSNAVEISTVTLAGDPRDVILDEAMSWGADLIVLGTRGIHGSVSEAVAAYASCSVEVVR